MPIPSKGIRLYLRKGRRDRGEVYYIRHGSREVSTNCGPDELDRANKKLVEYIARQYRGPTNANSADEVFVAEAINSYLKEHAPTKTSAIKRWIADISADIMRWWDQKKLSDVTETACNDYVGWRTAQPLTTTSKRTASRATAAHEPSVLRAASNHLRRRYAPTMAMPAVTLPKKPDPREGYFLDRKRLARRLCVAWRRLETCHIARMILLGLYSGSRLNAMLRLPWVPSFTGMTTAVLDRYYLHQSLEDQGNIVQTMHQKRISSASKRAQSR
jgi:hypothetical protein